jgi:dienelactone hydrolase
MRFPGLTVLLSAAVLGLVGPSAHGQATKLKRGLTEEDWKYSLAEGVTTREVTYFSDGTACWAKLFLPKRFSGTSSTPGIVLANGWAGMHFSIEKYGARFAERGLVAMVIDYRGWGYSDGFASLAERIKPSADVRYPDAVRLMKIRAEVSVKRTRLLPQKQVEDYRNAISFLQGEPGVDRDRIGVWGTSFAGGHVMVTAAQDGRVKAVVGQIPAIAGKDVPEGPVPLRGALLDDAIQRARTGQGGEFETGYSQRRTVDIETNQAVAEYHPFHYVKKVGKRPVLFIVAQNEELFRNRDHAYAALEVLDGPKKLIEIPRITHFQMYSGEAFERSSNAAADWFLEHLKKAAP